MARMIVPKTNQRGSARLKFLVFLIVVGALGYAGYVFVPVAYNAYLFKDLMQHEVDVAAAQGNTPAWVGEQLTKSLAEYDIPSDAIIAPTQLDNRIQVRVQFTRPLEFPGYTYQYEFDHTAKSTPFLSIK